MNNIIIRIAAAVMNFIEKNGESPNYLLIGKEDHRFLLEDFYLDMPGYLGAGGHINITQIMGMTIYVWDTLSFLKVGIIDDDGDDE